LCLYAFVADCFMSVVVSKNPSAVAVSDELTVLLDWVNIESFSGFTIIIENAGGGSGDDISDIQIDISSDGGLTSTLNHHPGVMSAVPIASGNAGVATFTETAAYIRIRGLCDEGKDTTANAILLATTSSAGLCTLSDIKERLGIVDAAHDIALNRIIEGIGSLFDSYTCRSLILTAADSTDYYTGCGPSLQVRRFPIVVITSIKESYDYEFDADSLLIVNEDYRLLTGGKLGIIRRVYSDWLDVPDSIEVVGRGGYCAADITPGEGEFYLPSDLREAAIEQATFVWKRKDDLGLSSVSSDGGSINKFSDMDLLPMVKRILDKYRLPSL
jgi:hypothetical protein